MKIDLTDIELANNSPHWLSPAGKNPNARADRQKRLRAAWKAAGGKPRLKPQPQEIHIHIPDAAEIAALGKQGDE